MSKRQGQRQPYHLLMARKADELMGDGEWHDHAAVSAALMDEVPASVAIRKAEEMRVRANKSNSPRTRARTNDQLVRIGARHIVAAFLRADCYEVDRKGTGRGNDPPRHVRQVRPHAALRGDRYRLARDQLTLKVDRLSKVITKMAKVMVDHGLAEDVERLTKGLKL